MLVAQTRRGNGQGGEPVSDQVVMVVQQPSAPARSAGRPGQGSPDHLSGQDPVEGLAGLREHASPSAEATSATGTTARRRCLGPPPRHAARGVQQAAPGQGDERGAQRSTTTSGPSGRAGVRRACSRPVGSRHGSRPPRSRSRPGSRHRWPVVARHRDDHHQTPAGVHRMPESSQETVDAVRHSTTDAAAAARAPGRKRTLTRPGRWPWR